MESSEEYRSKYSERRNRKLLNPRDRDGQPNEEMFAVVRELKETLKGDPTFIGVTPYGSRIKGYNRESSDMDVAVFYDSTLSAGDDIHIDALRAEQALHPKLLISFHDINVPRMQRRIQEGSLWDVAVFLLPSAGPQVEKYRGALREIVAAMPVEQQTQFVSDVTELLVQMDTAEQTKRFLRIQPHMQAERAALGARTKMWSEHVELLLGLRQRKEFDKDFI